MEDVKVTTIREPYGFIYITTNMVNGKRYIGQKKFDDKGAWKPYLGSGKLLKRAIEKYGKINFKRDILYVGFDKDEMDEKEQKYINDYECCASNDYYNIGIGGRSNPWLNHTDEEIAEWKRKIQIKNSGESHHCYGKKLSDYTKQKISNSSKGKIITDETKAKIAISSTGRIFTKETRQKMSDATKGKYQGFENKGSLKVICLNTGEIFDGVRDACRRTNIPFQNIIACCKDKVKSAGKSMINNESLNWMYLHEWNVFTEKEKLEILTNKNALVKKGKTKPVICINTQVKYATANLAEEYTKIRATYIISCCEHNTEYAGKIKETKEKLIWRYLDEYEQNGVDILSDTE